MTFATAGHAMSVVAEDGVHQPAIGDPWRRDGPGGWFSQIFDSDILNAADALCIGGFVAVSAASGFSQPLQRLKVALWFICGSGGKLCGFDKLFGVGSLQCCCGGGCGVKWCGRVESSLRIGARHRSSGAWEPVVGICFEWRAGELLQVDTEQKCADLLRGLVGDNGRLYRITVCRCDAANGVIFSRDE